MAETDIGQPRPCLRHPLVVHKRSGKTFDCGKDKRVAVKGTVIKCSEGDTVVEVKFKDNEGNTELVQK